LQAQIDTFLAAWNQDKPFVFHSSGSTGIPKTHTFSKAQLCVSAQASIAALQLNSATKALVCLPLISVGGLMQLTRALLADFELWITEPSSRPLENFELPLNFISMVPTQLQQSIALDLPKLKSIEQILIGGAPLSQPLIEQCAENQIELIQSYGMTETLSHVALRTVSDGKSGPFEALDGVQFSTKEDQLVIEYPALLNEPLCTTDLVELIDAQHFNWLGRADFAINTGGKKILPEQLEKKLSSSLTQAYFVCSLPDDKWGEIVALVVEGAAFDASDILKNQNLLPEELPRKIAFVTTFVRTETLKINRGQTLSSIRHADWRSL
jgi:O-succinylbenzoic acid--CoA ligase